MKPMLAALLGATLCATVAPARANWNEPKAPAVPGADGYVVIPDAAVPPTKTRIYRAVFDATHAAEAPTQILPALNMVGSEVNAMRVAGVPAGHAKFVVVFHGPAMDAILTNEAYRTKFGIDNPNLAVLSDLKKAGVELFVCGQNLAFEHRDPKTLVPTVRVASDALIVLMTYHADGYAILSF
jgi:intracellular sulfur oxidation DsrE/DsrF family protein